MDFQSSLYYRLYTAYKLLGKTQTSMDQLAMHVTSAIHNTAWNVVYGHAVLTIEDQAAEAELSKKQYPDLCTCMAPSSILPCLVDLCRALWNIMNSYRKLVDWHDQQRPDQVEQDDQELPKNLLERQYIERKLVSGKARIWQDVQTKTKDFVLGNDLSGLSIDVFLEFMDVIHRYY